MDVVTVLAVDDQPVFRKAVRELIEATHGFEQVGEAASGPQGLQAAMRTRPDLVLLDVRMPGMDGIETARRLRDVCPDAVVVLISIGPVTDLPAGIGTAAHLRKQELSPATLRRVWDANAQERT